MLYKVLKSGNPGVMHFEIQARAKKFLFELNSDLLIL